MRKLSEREQAVLELVNRHRGFTAAELAHIAGKGNTAGRLGKVLQRLADEGLLTYGNERWCCLSTAMERTYFPKGVTS